MCGNQYDPKGFGLLCNYGYLENSSFAFYQIGLNHTVIWLWVMTIFSISLFNSFGIAMTKYASAAQRSTIDTSRTLTIWILSCLLGLEAFLPLEIPGFILLITGTLLYNEIIVFPYLGFNQYTKDALAKQDGSDKRAGARLDQDYMATSPSAAYDSKRNVRQMQKKMDNTSSQQLLGDEFDLNDTSNAVNNR
jgi:hypothetical protein